MDYRNTVALVEERIQAACRRSGRRREDIELIAVTKYVDAAGAAALLQCGLKHLGENRWQQAQDKWEAIGDAAVWHFIGHLQTNKVKYVVGKFAYIHSLDRPALLQALQRRAELLDTRVNAFLQVNVSGEESKFGLHPEELFDFARLAADHDRVRIIGLMTMAPYAEDPEQSRPVFRGLRELKEELNARALLREPADHLSMGMSGDFEVAIEEGATWLRLGSILIGRD